MKLPRVSRRKDPASSVSAEVYINGKIRRGQITTVSKALSKYVGYTAFELSERIRNLDRYQVQRRLSDLRGAKPPLARNGRSLRKCSVTKRVAQTWYPV